MFPLGGVWRERKCKFGTTDISETTRARQLNLKIPLDMVKYTRFGYKNYYMIQHEDGRHIDFRLMSISKADYG